MTWTRAQEIVQLFALLGVLPTTLWRIWRNIDLRLTRQDERLIRIEAQFHRNGGTSLRDSVDRMDRELARLTGRFESHVEENL